MTNTTSPLQTMWDTRAPRIPNENGGNALLAGVCEGIGARYRVDPTVVRIAFVVLALLVGGGIFLYLLCWFTMPRISTGSSPMNAAFTPANRLSEEAAKEKSTGWLLLLGMIIFFPSITVGTRSGIAFASLTGLILGFVAWWILHNRTPVPPEGLNIPPAASGPHPPQPPVGGPQPQPPMGDGQVQAPQPQPMNDNVQQNSPYDPRNNPYAQ
ncbi:PspC domain-containing protein [Corynebacterium sp. p3-SID1145]|uniref:PspC domain-containing protein n=1 Tax=unclassified Corynebacterium TaxID=2624378 RepID=UPI0021A996BB|nr:MULTISPECIES: PspC domain-containing protein [unclassified Corynebacterium]MCT1452021.1 PspC domain-containing protein [Corynebacterium sp. p3-SID1145]MCT1461004.1 PspC domain-containing protein [Corynebacterium sp. p3-SID1140]